MIISILVGLFTSRFVLQALGASDFGLYNVVGGIVVLCTFILSSLSVTTTRFLNIEMGKKDGDLNKIFNVSNTVHITLAIIVLLVSEVIGIWYIYNLLNVETGKLGDAMFVFQVSIIASVLGVINVPYVSLFNAKENFVFSAIVNVGLSLLRLTLTIWLLFYDGNKIRAYALIMSLSAILSFVVYHIYSYKYWPDIVKWRIIKEWGLYKSVFTYNNYNILSTSAMMGRSQGAAILINYFFNTTVNGSYAVSKSVESYILQVSSNFDRAASPQITQNYSSGNYSRMSDLACNIGRYSLLISSIVILPIFAELDFILHLWLGNVPDGAVEFCQATLLVAFVSLTGAGITTISECDKIKVFKIVYSILLLACLPIGFFMYKMGTEPCYLIYLFAFMDLIWRVIHLILVKKLFNFNASKYVREVYVPVFIIGCIVIASTYLTSIININNDCWHFLRLFFLILLTMALSFSIGLKSGEKHMLIDYVKHKFNLYSHQ